MPYVEYPLLLILIFLVKSGISQDLGKNYELDFLKQNEQVFGAAVGD